MGVRKRGKDDQPDAEAVDAHVPVDLGIGDPDRIGDKLLPGLSGSIADGELQREQESEE